MADVQIAVIDQQNTQITLAAPSETEVTVAVPGVQGPVGEGVPAGGTANQVLFKQSGTDYDTAWSNVTSAMIGDLEITNADVAANAEIAVSKLADGSARQLLQTDAAGTGVEWTSNVDVPGTLDVTSTATFDNIASHPLGSAGAPTITFTGDTNTGIYSPGADQVAISTGGSGRLFVDASGNVGVGSPSNGNRLDVKRGDNSFLARFYQEGAGFNADVLINNAASASNFLISRRSSGESWFYNSGADPLVFHTNAQERLRITSTGDLNFRGAGTAGVTQAVSFNGSAPVNSMVLNSSGYLGLGTSSPGAGLHVANVPIWAGATTASTSGVIAMYGDGNNGTIEAFAGNNSSTKRNICLAPYGGSVGIGTTSPDYTLNVQGTVGIGKVGTSGTYNLFWAPNTIAQSVRWIRNNSGELAIGEGLTAGTNEHLRIDPSGRLLVGTSSALDTSLIGAAAFQVAGGTNATSQLSVSRFSGNSDLPRIALIKSRSGTVGSNTIVQNGDGLGEVAFIGADGSGATGYPFAASIGAYVDGTPGTNDMPGRLVFSTTADGASSPTERMRIRQDGNVLFGKTSLDFSVAGIQTEASSTSLTITRTSGDALTLRRNTDNGDIVSFYRDGTKVGSISVTTSATAYNTSSDYRLKENVVSVTDGITRLQQLKPSRFNFIADPSKTVDGFIAHEVQTVVPEAISGEKDAVDDEGNPVYQGIDQSKMVPLVVAALQECIKKVEALELELALLKSKP